MEHTAEGTFDRAAQVRCAGCGKPDHAHDPLPWQMTEGPCDAYCDECYRQLRRHEQAEEAIVAAMRAAKIHETYTPKLIREALDGIASTDPEWFDLLMQRGAGHPWQRRTAN